MSEQAHLALMLDAPLMSWGFASRFQRRTTALHPTRSGVLGMICAALGLPKGSPDEADWLGRLESIRMTVLTIPRLTANGKGELEIRRLDDFHTVMKTRSAENTIKKDAVLSHRQYLLDARFGVILVGPRETLDRVAHAMGNPRWGVWFGRKSCLPAAPILRGGGVLEGMEAALAALGLSGKELNAFARIEEAASFADGSDTLMDTPLNFETREFKPRRICRKTVEKE